MDKIYEFANRYNVRNIQVNRDRRSIDYYNMRASSYISDHEETIDMEIPRRSLEHLVEIDYEYAKLWQDKNDEAYMRRKHPALKEAYDKYKMLMELYR